MATTTRAQQQKDIVTYVLKVIGIDEETTKTIIETLKLNTVAKLRGANSEYLESLCEKEKLAFGDITALQNFKLWMSNTSNIPGSLDGWKEEFTDESYETYGCDIEGEVPRKEENVEEVSVDDLRMVERQGKSTTSTVSVKIADYPDFNGKNNEWYTYKEMHEATAKLAGYSELLFVSDDLGNVDAHIARRGKDKDYDAKVRYMYAILLRKTAKGQALSKVKMYRETEDGALAWLYLKKYYDKRETRRCTVRTYSRKLRVYALSIRLLADSISI
jgi:hypothetical protein